MSGDTVLRACAAVSQLMLDNVIKQLPNASSRWLVFDKVSKFAREFLIIIATYCLPGAGVNGEDAWRSELLALRDLNLSAKTVQDHLLDMLETIEERAVVLRCQPTYLVYGCEDHKVSLVEAVREKVLIS